MDNKNSNELQFALISVALKSLGKMLVDVAEQLMLYNRKEFRINKEDLNVEDVKKSWNVKGEVCDNYNE